MNNILSTVIDTLNASALSHFIMENAIVFPALEMAHFLGLCLLFGSLLIVDLRVVGMAKTLPMERVEVFINFAVIGFTINAVSGLLFVIGDSDRYLVNILFWVKMSTILIAGLNTVYFVLRVKPQMRAGINSKGLTKDAHLVAWASLLLWSSVITFGRLMPYVE
ncbi:hypothetical protein J8L70_02310 [Pseudoalteromonas sp. MMG010]|uniref:DUF6644 family protein n=1 Tax=Pseudoalteromonas sp. MMG010 TaxID=2822685 RepID=UPI001B39D9F7|nr:DUF6644 family protein [Pseudoalteromonas sp. MMG010]MBQ4832066.1 hypothetical protein [Pseudoalteromonas sp. MMG010]